MRKAEQLLDEYVALCIAIHEQTKHAALMRTELLKAAGIRDELTKTVSSRYGHPQANSVASKVRQAFEAHPKVPLTMEQLRTLTGGARDSSITGALYELKKAGKIKRVERGVYQQAA